MVARICNIVLKHTGRDRESDGRMRWRIVVPVICLLAIGSLRSGIVLANSLQTIDRLNQAQFEDFSENLSAATQYTSLAPPEALGPLGFDVGLAVSVTDIQGSLFDLASDDDFSGGSLIIPRIQVQKGFLFGLDIGASLGAIPDTDATLVGGEVRYSIVRGDVVTPTVSIRATHSEVLGLDDYSLRSSGIELGVSKGFLILTPYASVGIVHSKGDPDSIDGLSSETFNQTKVTIGAVVNIGVALTAEVANIDDFQTYSAKLGIRF